MSANDNRTMTDAASARKAKRPLWQRIAIHLAVDGVLFFVAWCAVMYVYQDRLLFPADLAGEPARRPPPSAEVLHLDIGDGRTVEAWFFPAPGAGPDSPAPAVIYFHGNAELIDSQADVARDYQRLGFSVLLPEYRGYGRSTGTPSQEVIRADMIRWYDRLAGRADVDRRRIVFHGRSLGGAVAADLAAARTPAGLILESTFFSVVSMARRYGVPGSLAKNPFRTDRVVRDFDGPLLIFHGTRDSIIPVSHGRRLRDLNPRARYVEYDCDHNDFPGPGNWEAYQGEIRRFLSTGQIVAVTATAPTGRPRGPR